MRESAAPPETRQVLERTPAFEDLARDVLDRVTADVRLREFEPGEFVVRQGDPGDGLLVLVSGKARVELRAGHDAGSTGSAARTIAGFGPGDVMGEMSLVTRQPRSADIVAVTPVRALWLSVHAFDRLVAESPEMGVVTSNIVANRLGERSLDGLGGKEVGDYRIVRSVGRGAMGVVYEAVRRSDGRTVALKMMSHRLLYERGAATRFQREAATLMRLDHRNVTRVYDCFPAYRTSFIAMEFCDGVDVERLQETHGALAEEHVRRIVGQMAVALVYLHGKEIVHRDLKPSNVMLTRDGVAKLTDFGLARQLALPPGASITEECTLLGTPRYMSYARLAGGRPGPESDVYALGLIALELCQGVPSFVVTSLADLMRQKEAFVPPPAPAIGRGISDELHAFVVAATTGTPQEALDALARAAAWAAPVPASLVAAVPAPSAQAP